MLYGCVDGDGDGWADSMDAYPADVLLWSDGDEDGYADQQDTDCRTIAPRFTAPRAKTGSVVSIPTATAGQIRPMPILKMRPNTKPVCSRRQVLYVGLAVLLVVVVLLMRVGRRRGPSPDLASLPAVPQPPVAVAPTAPPLPPEGLPLGGPWNSGHGTARITSTTADVQSIRFRVLLRKQGPKYPSSRRRHRLDFSTPRGFPMHPRR